MSLATDQAALFAAEMARVVAAIQERAAALPSLATTSTPAIISDSLATLPAVLPDVGLGLHETTTLLLDKVCPALSGGQAGPRFFGLVTGGVVPAAALADHLVTAYDPCVQVFVPEETISVALEHQALNLLLNLLRLPVDQFTSNTFTTGATASNLLGLTLGREYTVAKVSHHRGVEWSVGEQGFGGVGVDVFVACAHASMGKAASIAGLGRTNVHDLSLDDKSQPCAFDLVALEQRLKANFGTRGSIVATSFGEVNTGGFTPHSRELRRLCDKYDAWLHFDAAFGAFAVLHPDFADLSAELALADSITSDAHKWLNVPYDCGIFLSRSPSLLRCVCGPGASVPAYLTSSSTATTSSYPLIDPYRALPPPLFVNIENSRRFRALPVWATLVSLGRGGVAELVQRNIAFARKVEKWMRDGGGRAGYEILLPSSSTLHRSYKTLNIVLFAPSPAAPARFQGREGSTALVKAINESRECYVTGTSWRGRGAIRLAVSNWGTELERDFAITSRVLERVMSEAI